MTIDTLEQHRGLIAEIKALDAEILALYDVRKSPNGREPTGNASGPSAPTERAVARILELKDKQRRKKDEWERAVKEIEKWLDTVADADIRSIVRWHYVLGYNWKRTSREVFGTDSYYRARKKLLRYFEKS
jgi:hypothetical protein